MRDGTWKEMKRVELAVEDWGKEVQQVTRMMDWAKSSQKMMIVPSIVHSVVTVIMDYLLMYSLMNYWTIDLLQGWLLLFLIDLPVLPLYLL